MAGRKRRSRRERTRRLVAARRLTGKSRIATGMGRLAWALAVIPRASHAGALLAGRHFALHSTGIVWSVVGSPGFGQCRIAVAAGRALRSFLPDVALSALVPPAPDGANARKSRPCPVSMRQAG